MDIEFGAKVREARRQAGLTLDELARRSGVSRSALSKIERGERNPSLQHALRIADGLGRSLSELLGAPALPRVRVTRRDAGWKLVDPSSGAVREALFPPIHGLEVVRYTLPPRASAGPFPAHPAGTVEVFVILHGELIVEAAGERIHLAAGDAAATAADAEHVLSNPGAEATTFILLIVPPR